MAAVTRQHGLQSLTLVTRECTGSANKPCLWLGLSSLSRIRAAGDAAWHVSFTRVVSPTPKMVTMDSAANVLLIEDDEADRQLVQELVAFKGRGRIQVTEARDLPTGLALLSTRPFDLVLLDTRLPDVSALSALRAVGERAPEIPILSHVTFITFETRRAASARGPFDVVVRGELNPMWVAMSSLLAPAEHRA
jgi:CheY-like chemotaxis protein